MLQPFVTHSFVQEVQVNKRLISNILPEGIAGDLFALLQKTCNEMVDKSSACLELFTKRTQNLLAHMHDFVCIMFADLVGFTSLVGDVDPMDLMQLLDRLFCTFDDFCKALGVWICRAGPEGPTLPFCCGLGLLPGRGVYPLPHNVEKNPKKI